MKNETKKEESGEVWETTKTEKKEEKNTRDEGKKGMEKELTNINQLSSRKKVEKTTKIGESMNRIRGENNRIEEDNSSNSSTKQRTIKSLKTEQTAAGRAIRQGQRWEQKKWKKRIQLWANKQPIKRKED